MCAKCEPGQIIVSQLTSMLARNSGHTFTSIGDLELRGIPEPVAAFTVAWAPAAVAATIDIPDRLRPDMNRPIAGRVLDTESLAQAWKSSSSGERRLTFVEMRQLVEISAERELVEAGDLNLDGDTWVVKDTFDEFALPQSIRDVVGQRIARLGTESVTALTAAAVIGREFDLALVAVATDTDDDDLLDHFDAAVAAGVLTEEPGGDEQFRFVHSLARTTLVAGLSDGRARRMHRKIAEALETLIGNDPGDRVGELATHWMAAAAPIEKDKAIHFAQLAGRRALQALAPDEAIRWFTTAIEHLELSATTDVRLRAELLVEPGTAQQHIGENLAERAIDRAQGGVQGVVDREARTLLETLSEG